VNKSWAKKLAQSNLTLIYSVDGVTKEVYENIRKRANFYDLIKSIDILNEYRRDFGNDSSFNRLNFVLNFVVMKSNLNDLDKVINFAIKYKFNEVRFAEVKFLQNEENIFLHRNKEALGYIKKIMPDISRKAKEHGIILHNWFLDIDSYFGCKNKNFNNDEEKN